MALPLRIWSAADLHRLRARRLGSPELTVPTGRGDIGRQNALVRAGWTVLRYPWSVIVNHPEQVESEVIETRARLSAGR